LEKLFGGFLAEKDGAGMAASPFGYAM
jgi:hypothetical protein